MNIWRHCRCVFLKLKRQSYTTKETAFGLSFGVFISCILPVGQILMILFCRRFFRFNYKASLISVWISNPWTIPFFYASFLYIGKEITELSSYPLNFIVGSFVLGSLLSLLTYAISTIALS